MTPNKPTSAPTVQLVAYEPGQPLAAADEAALLDLGRQTFAETFAHQNTEADMAQYLAEHFTPAHLQQELAEPNARFLLAHADGQPAGYGKLRTVEQPPELAGQLHLELERIYVLQAFQGRQVGRALLEAAVGLARQQGFAVLWLGVWEHNRKARAFYERAGFVHFGQHVFRLGSDDQLDYLYKLDLR